jgi:hypothetical protein
MKKIKKAKSFYDLIKENDEEKEIGGERIPKPEKKPEKTDDKEDKEESDSKNENKVVFFDEFITEGEGGGVAYATAGNGGGMGAITAPVMSDTPGDMRGSTAGSGDVAAYDKGKHFGEKPQKKKKTNKKKRHTGTTEQKESMYVTSYKDWNNTGM